MRLVTTSTRSSLLDLWPKDFVWCSTSNHLFTPYKMYCSTLRAIDINCGSLAFVNNSHHWLVIKRCLSMFESKSYIRMARLVPEWPSEWDKKTPDLASAIRAAILGLLYTSSVRWPYIYIFIWTWAYICRHVYIGQHSSVDDFLNYVHVIRLFMCWTWECLPSEIMIKRIYHDVMYYKIDAGFHSASSPTHHSVKHINENIVVIILTSWFRGQLL